MKQFILSVLQIKAHNIDFTHTEVEEAIHKGIKSLFITAKLTYDPTHCPECGCINAQFSIVKNGPGYRELPCRIFLVCPRS
ncbi:hypothetical protein [Salinicoccus albus]|uniref:hypothetical protein n=1 Tax=Salinicoccus albus TaxID=418756 RepID=UPI0003A2C5F6|nr:hypothetical protein [Salinicoccus albus]